MVGQGFMRFFACRRVRIIYGVLNSEETDGTTSLIEFKNGRFLGMNRFVKSLPHSRCKQSITRFSQGVAAKKHPLVQMSMTLDLAVASILN